MKLLLLTVSFLFSCTKQEKYTCVCYPYSSPENYEKYTIYNNNSEATEYCDVLSNSQKKCSLTK